MKMIESQLKFLIASLFVMYTALLNGQQSALMIGDEAFGGIVFYISPDGKSGKVIADANSISSYEWGCYNSTVNGTDSSFGTGLVNSLAIDSQCNQANIAAKFALSAVINGYSDWYLPSIGELRFAHHAILNANPYNSSFTSPLWSSSQFPFGSSAYFYNPTIAGGIISWGSKFATRKVRLIRDFCISESNIVLNEVFNETSADTVQIDLGSVSNVLWNDGDVSAFKKISQSGYYYFTGIDTNNCEVSDEFFVTINNPKITVLKDTICSGENITLNCVLNQDTLEFNNLDVGPSFGYVFYDQGNYVDGWRYLEAARLCDSGSYGCNGTNISNASNVGIGYGYANSLAIINSCNQLSAAKRCALRTINGFNDFFLPSLNELNQIYNNLLLNNVDIFGGVKPGLPQTHWSSIWPNGSSKFWGFISSTQTNSVNAYRQSFIDGAVVDWPGKTHVYQIKPTRRFSPIPKLSWSTGDSVGVVNIVVDSTKEFYIRVDYMGVVSYDTITIYVVPDAILVLDSLVQPTCSGSQGGVISLLAQINQTYNWYTNGLNVGTGSSIQNRGPGIYICEAINQFGCSSLDTFMLIQESPIVNSYLTKNVSCEGGSDGKIKLLGTSAIRPLAFNVDNLPFNDSIIGLTASTYIMTYIDSIGCDGLDTLVISQPNAISIQALTATNVSCYQGQDGSVIVGVTGGNGGYVSSWKAIGTSAVLSSSMTLSGVASGVYRYTVVDAKGCTDSLDITITQPVAPLSTSISSHTDVLCFGASTGFLSASGTGGTIGTGYSFSWNNSLNNVVSIASSASGLSAGIYTCLITDIKGCTAQISDTITQPSSAVSLASNGSSNVSCFGGNNGVAWVSPTGGVSPYGYTWSNSSVNDSISGLIAGSYSVTVTDNNGCTQNQLFAITQPTLLTNSYSTSLYYGSTNVSCPGGSDGSIDLTPNGGTIPYTYLWSNNAQSQDLNGLTAGVYAVTITDSKGCQSTRTVTLTDPADFVWTNSVTDVTCNGLENGAITLGITGGNSPYQLNWNTSASQAGKTEVTFRVDMSQQSISSLGIGAVFQGSVGILSLNDLYGDSVFIGNKKFNPGDTIYWRYFNGSNSETVPFACGAITSLSVFERYLVVPDHDTILPIICFSSCTNCNGMNSLGQSGTIQTISKSMNNLGAGTYNFSLTDRNGCVSSQNIPVYEPFLLTITQDSIQNLTCYQSNNGAIYVSIAGGNGGHTYLWSNGATTEDLTGLSAGTYTLTVTDSKNCTTTASYTITQPDSLAASSVVSAFLGTNNISCNGASDGSIDLTISGGTSPYSYAWNTGDTTQDITTLTAGSYSVLVTDANGCQIAKSYTLTQPSALQTTTSSTDVTCNGNADGSLTITPNGGTAPYLIQFVGDSTASTQSMVTFRLNMDSSLVGSAVNIIIKNGGTHQLTNQPSTNIYWGTFSLIEGDTVYYRYANGSLAETVPTQCGLNSGGTVIERWLQVPTSDTILPLVCFESCTNCDGSAPQGTSGYLTDTMTVLNQLYAGSIVITVTDLNGCSLIISDTLNEPNQFIASTLVQIDPTCPQNPDGMLSINVLGGTTPYSLLWNNGSTNDTLANIPVGNYWVNVQDANGCSDSLYFTLTAPEPFDFEDICVLSVDSATGKNLVVWNKTPGQRTLEYRILKENAQGQFVQIGIQPYLNLSVFTDQSSNPQTQPDRYKIALLDSCGNSSDTSDFHRTIHLQSNLGSSGEVNLSWTPYLGKPVQSYEIWRWITSGNLVQIATVAASVSSYTDLNPPVASNVYYVVNAVFPSSCSPVAGKNTAFDISKSNILNQTGIGFNEIQALRNMRVYPNPNGGVFTVEFSNIDDIQSVSIIDGVGRVIRHIKTVDNTKILVDLRNEPKGVYRINATYSSGQANVPIVVH